jgi:hypothetical protein
MADTLALEKLYDDVVARFTAEGTAADFGFGWREPAKNVVHAARIAWVPGNRAGVAGKLGPARNPGRNPRPLATLHEYFHIVISATEIATHEDERSQYRAVRLLRDAVHRAMYLAARGTFAIESEDWIDDRKERRYGAALIMTCTVEAMVPDEALDNAPIDVAAEIALSELNVTETQTITAADTP